MLRAALLIASAVVTGASYGRKRLGEAIDKRAENAIESAAETARARIKSGAQSYLSRQVRDFVRNTLIKAGLLATAWALFQAGAYGASVLAGLASALLALFLVRDAVRVWPAAPVAIAELRRHGWRPKTALTETIAAQVFDDVLEEAERAHAERGITGRALFAVAGRQPDTLNRQIAEAVRDVARRTTWADLKPFLLAAAAEFAALAALYSVFVFLLLSST